MTYVRETGVRDGTGVKALGGEIRKVDHMREIKILRNYTALTGQLYPVTCVILSLVTGRSVSSHLPCQFSLRFSRGQRLPI